MGPSCHTSVDAADLILLDAEALTLSACLPKAEAVAVRDGVIVAVSGNRDLRGLAGPRTTVIECDGRCLVPGFHDAHIHLLACASNLLGVDCGPQAVSSMPELQQAISRRAAILPAGQWIRAGAYDECALTEKRHPTRWDLDAAAPHHPVRLLHRSYHACVLNSLALRMAHLDACPGSLPERLEVDPRTGEPTGLIYEIDECLGKDVIPPVGETDLRAAVHMAATDLLSKGITSIQDATVTNGLAEWRLFESITSDGTLGPRITMMIGQEHLPQMMEVTRERANQWLRSGHVKIMLTETRDGFHPETTQLFDRVWQAHRLGLAVAIHAVEESTVCLAIEAIAAALERLPRPDHRHRIEHASVVPGVLLDRMAELGIAVVTQPGFVYFNGARYRAEVDQHVRQWLYPVRSMLARGISVAAGSDAPVVTADPLASMYAAVTRRSVDGDVVVPAQGVTAEEALRMHTSVPARLAGQETSLGVIAPGMLADLVLLSANPLRVDGEAIREITVDLTIVDGRVVWQRAAADR